MSDQQQKVGHTAGPWPTDRQVEAAARAIWDAWRASDIAKPMYRDIGWDWLTGQDPDSVAGKYVVVGRAEARAALMAIGVPDMLAALRPLAEWADNPMAKPSWDDCVRARDAVAKAEGRNV